MSPYSNPTTDYLNQLQAIHSMVSANVSGGPAGSARGPDDPSGGRGFVPPRSSTQGTQSWSDWGGGFSGEAGQDGIGPDARQGQVNNTINVTRGGARTGAGVGTAQRSPNARGQYDYKGTNIPQDMQGLRTNLGSYLSGQVGKENPNYFLPPGSEMFNLATPVGARESYDLAGQQVPTIGGMLQPGQDTLSSLMGFNAGADFSGLYPTLNALLSGPTPQLDLNSINQFGQSGYNNAVGYGNNAVAGANQYGQNAWNSASAFGGQAANAFGSAMPTAMNIAQTGGVPTNMLLQALDAIHKSGQIDIEHNLAGIREKYGAQGLGQGSDVNSALALGATQGQAQLEAQQSSLLTSVLQNAAQTQLGGLNALQGIGAGYTGVGNLLSGTAQGVGGLLSSTNVNAGNLVSGAAGMAGGLNAQAQGLNLGAQQTAINAMLGALPQGMNILQQPVTNQLNSAGVQLGAASQLPAYGNTMNSAFAGAQGAYGNLAQLNQQANMYTNNAQYQNFQRQFQTLPPGLQAALGFGTAFPPVNQGPSTAGSLIGGGMAAGGSILGAMILTGMLSDRNMKEDIRPITSVRDRLERLPISTWRYKGDSVRHIGPMAQDFQSAFEVGDGHVIYPIDVLGVLLQSQKEMSLALRN